MRATMLGAILAICFGCGSAADRPQNLPKMLADDEHEHYHVHSARVAHEHDHDRSKSGGHVHNHAHETP